MSKVGLLIIATNKYITFLQPLIDSADKFFLGEQDVTYFIFSNMEFDLKTTKKIVKTNVEHKPWPWMTLGRYDIFTKNSDHLKDMDYLFYCDADMLFLDTVGNEILSDRVATQHPAWYGRRGTPEENPKSLACVYPNEEMQYFAGGFNGGSTSEFLIMSNKLSQNITDDFNRGIIAIWHDESHINRYFIDNIPTKILDPSYCYPGSWEIPFQKRLLALVKDHSVFQK